MADSNFERLQEILSQLSINQLRYVAIRNDCATNQEAAKRVGISAQIVSRWPNIVDEAVKLMAFDGVLTATELLRRSVSKAAEVKMGGLDSDNENVRQASATEILDRMLGKATQRTDITSGGKTLQGIDDARYDRSITALADAIRKALPGQGAGATGPVDAAERPAVDGLPEQGG